MMGQQPHDQFANPAQPLIGQQQVYTYQASHNIYAIGFSVRPDQPFRLALCSFFQQINNQFQIIQLSNQTNAFQRKAHFLHQYPANKVLWIPDKTGNYPDVLATSGQNIKLWEVKDNERCQLKVQLNTNSKFSAPLTSFDWNIDAINLICTSSIDTTCTVWDLQNNTIVKQMIAHQNEVHDIAFSVDKDIFASVSADGSLRQFDLRHLKHSTLLYQTPDNNSLLKMAWNRNDKNYIAVLQMQQNYITLIDCRNTSKACSKLKHHRDCVNAICWAPHSSTHICSVGDDKQALIWDLSYFRQEFQDPLLEYKAQDSISNLCWSLTQNDWLSICYADYLQILKT